jgi:hypothetical protein
LQKIIPEVPIVYCYQQLGIEKLAKETTFNMIFNEANLLQLSSSLKIIRKKKKGDKQQQVHTYKKNMIKCVL